MTVQPSRWPSIAHQNSLCGSQDIFTVATHHGISVLPHTVNMESVAQIHLGNHGVMVSEHA